MSDADLIDSRVSLKQCSKAVEALHSHQLKKNEKYEQDQLLPAKEQHIWLNVTVKTIPTGHKLKPVKIPIAHPLVDPRTTPVCLITKDPQREYKDLLETHNIKFISRVVGLEKLKGKFKPFEARRILLKENGLFLADDRIIPLLPKLLGSKWFEAKKQPMPVCLTRKDLKGELERAISSTYMNQNQGTCTSIKIGKMSQTPSQIIANIKTAIPAIIKAIKGNWDNIQSLNIKTNSSASLPIWSCNLDDAEGGRWHGLNAEVDEGEDVVGSGSEEEEDAETVRPKRTAASKGKKRPSSSDEEEEVPEKPAKKSKSADGTVATKTKAPSAATKTPSAAVITPTQSKKRKVAQSVEIPTKAVSPSATPLPAGKKSKAAAIDVNTTVAESASSSESVIKKQKKAAKSQEPTLATQEPQSAKRQADAAPSKKLPSIRAVAVADKSVKETKKNSKLPEVVTSDSPATSAKAVKPSLSKEEMKKKRSTGAGEKKKEIILKAKGGKSAKNAVLGKKVAQE
ncbi:hypothetical protein HYPSUDRAFT_45706 [Hypholoma sublateritium FD-334 SS-4]|uniref:Ribosomal L1 domain-containing protein 1 n=1 Tax=Hypholoma sublateritium (strain FD-334 SS-4) TaxID=945553 RepID=A0A0D2NMN4_HYPSF|nr:hypothetical protein HYPSUDRAFT_45706 [Hypholoma sublateritium FD-334 SS-4]